MMKYKTADTQPDIYFYNVNGISGKLFLDETGTPRTIPFKNYMITPAVGPLGVGSWTLITDSGDKYIFSKIEQTRTTVAAGISEYDLPKNYPSSWYLTQIVSKNGFDIYSFQYDETAEILVKTNSGLNEYRTDINGNYDPICASGIAQGFSAGPVTYIKQVFLKKITDNHGRSIEINNVADRTDYLGSYRHNSIVVKEGTKTLLTATLYNNQYFGSGTETAKRLKLDRVELTGTQPTEPEVYRFQYNSNGLPDRLSMEQDLWGYYKATGGSTMIPAMEGLPGGVDRSPDENTTKACNLEKVYFPTGGYQVFTYELNGAGSTPLGGLRVKEINWYDDNSALEKKIVYRYVGQQVSSPVFSTPNTLIRLSCPNENPNPPSCLYTTRFAANRSQLGASAGSHVGYRTVEEEVRDFNDASGNGKTVYSFYVPSLTNPYPFSAPAFQDAVPLGLLLSKKIYNSNNILLSSEENCYQGIVAENANTEALIPSSRYYAVLKKSMLALQLASELTTYSKQLQWKYSTDNCTILYDRPCTFGANGYSSLGYVPLKPYQFNYTSKFAFYPIGKVIRNYANGQELVQAEKYTYSTNTTYNFLVAKRSSTSLSGDSIYTQMVYPFELSGQPYTTMIAKNMLTQMIEKKVSRKNQAIVPTYGEKYAFQSNGYAVLPISYSIAGDGTTYREEISGIAYDAFGNVTQLTEKGVQKGMLWDGLYLLAEIKGSSVLLYEGFEGLMSGYSTTARAGTKASMDAYVASPISGVPNCILTYWKKPSSGKWQYVEVPLTSSTTIGGSGTLIDEVRIYPAGAQMTTYSHDKGLGIITTMDINNRATYFSYDDKRRLRRILDDDKKILKMFTYHYRTGPIN